MWSPFPTHHFVLNYCLQTKHAQSISQRNCSHTRICTFVLLYYHLWSMRMWPMPNSRHLVFYFSFGSSIDWFSPMAQCDRRTPAPLLSYAWHSVLHVNLFRLLVKGFIFSDSLQPPLPGYFAKETVTLRRNSYPPCQGDRERGQRGQNLRERWVRAMKLAKRVVAGRKRDEGWGWSTKHITLFESVYFISYFQGTIRHLSPCFFHPSSIEKWRKSKRHTSLSLSFALSLFSLPPFAASREISGRNEPGPNEWWDKNEIEISHTQETKLGNERKNHIHSLSVCISFPSTHRWDLGAQRQ